MKKIIEWLSKLKKNKMAISENKMQEANVMQKENASKIRRDMIYESDYLKKERERREAYWEKERIREEKEKIFFGKDMLKKASELHIDLGYCSISTAQNSISVWKEKDEYTVYKGGRKVRDGITRKAAHKVVFQIIEQMEEEYINRPSPKDYWEKYKEKVKIPNGIEIVYDVKMDEWIDEVDGKYDGGRLNNIVWLSISNDNYLEKYVESIIDWKKRISDAKKDIRTEWLAEYANDYYNCQHKDLSVLHAFRTVILSEGVIEVSDKLKNLMVSNEITIGKMLESHDGYFDCLTNETYCLNYETYPGMVDDAATYVSWSWCSSSKS